MPTYAAYEGKTSESGWRYVFPVKSPADNLAQLYKEDEILATEKLASV